MVVQESRLLALPDEILINIVSYLDSTESLCEARQVCSHLKELVDPIIFRDYDILHGEKSSRLAILLGRDDRRAAWLRSVLVSTKYDEDRGLEHFPNYLRRMRNLKNLILETPDCNSKSPKDRVRWVNLQKQYEAIFQQSSVAIPQEQRLLPNLEECTMHFVDDTVSLYPLTKYSSIFLHPTLKSLTLSCCCTDLPSNILKDYRQYRRTTALEHVHFEECDFDSDSLEILLKFPKELKSLKMSEGERYSNDFGSRHSRLHGNLNPGLLSHTLSKSVSNSLEILSISLGFQRARGQTINSPGRSLELKPLTNLKRLEIGMSTLGLLITRPKCDHQLYRRLPASLETIRVFTIPLLILRGKPPSPFQPCVIRDKAAHGLPNLKHLIYCYEYQAPRGRSSFGLIQHRGEDTITRIIEASKDNIKHINEKNFHLYRSAGVQVTLEVEVTPPGFIPPYLHSEEKPTRNVIWETTDPSSMTQTYAQRADRAARAALAAGNRDVRHADGNVEIPSEAAETSQASNAGLESGEDGLVEETEEDDDDDEQEQENALALMHLAPQAQELFELLVMQPGQPFQL